MKKLILTSTLFLSLIGHAQTWQTVGYPGGFVNSVDTFQNKLFIAGYALNSFDGTTWNNVGNNTLSIKTSNNLLFMGVKDFSTNGEQIIKTYDGTTIAEKQGHRQFQYHANKKIIGFAKVGNTLFMSDYYTLFAWDDTSTFWRTVMPSPNIKKLFTFNNKLAFYTSNELYFYDGTTLDSMGFSNINVADNAWFGSLAQHYVKGNTLYLTGMFTHIINVAAQQAQRGNILTLTGSTTNLLSANFTADTTGMGLARLNCIFVDDNNQLFVTANKDPNVNDVHLIKYSSSTWSDVSKLVEAGKGLYPQLPGSELADYNLIFAYNNAVFVGGRFVTIGGDSILNLAKLNTSGGTGLTEVKHQTITCYPNPTTNIISLNATTELEVSCMDITGKTVLTTTTQNGSFSTDNLQNGIYFITAIDKRGQHFKAKFIKQQ